MRAKQALTMPIARAPSQKTNLWRQNLGVAASTRERLKKRILLGE